MSMSDYIELIKIIMGKGAGIFDLTVDQANSIRADNRGRRKIAKSYNLTELQVRKIRNNYRTPESIINRMKG